MPDQISKLNLETVRLLIDSWVDLAEEQRTGKPKKKKSATMADVEKFRALLGNVE